MSNEELIARLHLPWPKDEGGDEVTLPLWVLELTTEAADRIEELEAKLAKVAEGLHDLAKDFSKPSAGLTDFAECQHYMFLACRLRNKARATLAELKGQNYE